MARVNRLMERRALRRAADQALLTSLDNVAPSQAGGPADRDFVYRGEPTATATHDHEPATEPIPVARRRTNSRPRPTEVSSFRPSSPSTSTTSCPTRPADSEWDDVGLAAAADHAVTEPTDDYGWLERDDVLPLAPSSAPESASRRRTRLLRACSRLRRVRRRAAGIARSRRPACLSRQSSPPWCAAVGWLFRSPGTTAEESNADERRPVHRRHRARRRPQRSALRNRRRPATPTASPAAVGRAHLFRALSGSTRRVTARRHQQQKPRVDVTRAPMSVAPVPRPVPGSDSNTPVTRRNATSLAAAAASVSADII